MPQKPSSLYTVKILSEAEFDKLPFKHAKTSLGAADPSTNVAYVRDTGYNDITKDTIAHELDELMAKVSPHEEDGIRYKNLGSVFKGFGNAIGSVAKPVLKGVGAIAKAPFQLGGAAIKGLTKPGGVFGKFGGGAAAPSPTVGPPAMSLPGGGVGDVFGNVVKGLPQIASPTGPTVTGSTGNGGIANMFKRLGGSLFDKFAARSEQGSEEGGQDAGAFDLFKSAAVPLATSAVGNLFAPKVEEPDFSEITGSLRDQITGTGGTASAIRQLGEQRLTENLNTDLSAPPDELFEQGDRLRAEQLTDDLKSLEQAFKAANPNVNIANNSAFLEARNDLIERSNLTGQEQRARVSAEFVQQQKTLRLQEIQTALNLDQAQTQQLVQLAQLDVAQIMARVGISFGEAQQVKQLFGDLGSTIAQGRV